MNVRRDRLDGAADRKIGSPRIIGMNATLQADFRGAALPGLAAAALDFLERKIIGAAA
jgi:hypothetical protein